MTIEEKIQYWVGISDYDMDTAVAMLQSRRYLYVSFMCHQVVEKILKACYTKLKEDTPPFIHNLIHLAERCDLFEMLSDEQKKFVVALTPLNIEARYPEYKKSIAQTLSHAKCEAMIEQTKALQQWIKETILLPK
ncbi:MAG: HEPN domain-containing protein [Prevotellaceae bacterium]|jgi:HEPN domain-containing protein|nr:HEPN domain-containing protein [Prevotellaceae bacterium]